jgi:alkylation response protein AidB-like acyl-CoA dehydrogenase
MERQEVAQLHADVDDFVAAWCPPAPAVGEREHFAHLVEFQRSLHAAGLAVVAWPHGLGGRGLGPAEAAYVARALGEAGTPELANFVGIEVLAPAMLKFGEPERLAAWLPSMADASQIWCQMFSEPDAGSDLAALGCRAERDGEGWRLTGQKIWSTWGHFADRALVLARTGTVASRHRGITAFVVDMADPGIEARPLRTMTGVAEFAEVFLDGVRVPDADVVGEVGKGWDVTLHILGSERGPYAVRRASVIRAEVNRALAVARAGGASEDARQAVLDAVVARFLLDCRLDAVVEGLERGETPGAEAALTKLLLTGADQAAFAASVELMGVGGQAWQGLMPEPIAGYLYSRSSSIYGGTSQIQHNIIAERLLGLPRLDA